MTNNPLITVIVPVYNVEKYIKKCLDSICNQTYRNLEIILIDDGATDQSGVICDAYASRDDRIQVIHKENEGQATARNCALDIAKGEYLAFIDSDDYIKENMFAVMLREMMETDSDVGICGIVFRHGKNMEKPFSYVSERVYGDNDLLMKKYFSQKVFTGMCNKIYKADLFSSIRFPKVRLREDTYIMHEVLGGCSRFVEFPECFYVQNIRAGSTEQKPFSREKLDVSYEALSRRKAYAKKNYPQYVSLCELLLANLLYQILLEIVEKNGAKKNDALFRELFLRFQQEVAAVKADVLPEKNVARYEQMKQLAKHHSRMYRICQKEKLVRFGKGFIKRVARKVYGE